MLYNTDTQYTGARQASNRCIKYFHGNVILSEPQLINLVGIRLVFEV